MKFDVDKLKEELDNLVQAGWLEKFNIDNFIENIKDIEFTSPNIEDVFNAFKIGENNSVIKPKDVRILILGQDPYPETGKAHGYAFSVLQKYTDEHGIDDSLSNIFKAIKAYKNNCNFDEVNINKIQNTDLKDWATENKVLLLNTVLTYEKTKLYENIDKKTKEQQKKIKNAQSRHYTKHKNIWQPLFNAIIKTIITYSNNKIFIFIWGQKAQKAYNNAVKGIIINTEKIKKYETSHPSNLGVRKGFSDDAPNHFKVCDEFLGEDIWKNFPENNQ